jgi:hypothetical protein
MAQVAGWQEVVVKDTLSAARPTPNPVRPPNKLASDRFFDPGGYAGEFYFASASIRASNAANKLKLEIGDEENRVDCCDRCGDPALFLR